MILDLPRQMEQMCEMLMTIVTGIKHPVAVVRATAEPLMDLNGTHEAN